MRIFRDFVPVPCKHATNSDFHFGLTLFRSHVNRTYVDRVKAIISYVHSKKRRRKPPKNRRCMDKLKEDKGNLYLSITMNDEVLALDRKVLIFEIFLLTLSIHTVFVSVN